MQGPIWRAIGLRKSINPGATSIRHSHSALLSTRAIVPVSDRRISYCSWQFGTRQLDLSHNPRGRFPSSTACHFDIFEALRASKHALCSFLIAVSIMRPLSALAALASLACVSVCSSPVPPRSTSALEPRDADFESVRTRLTRDHSGRKGDSPEKYFHESVYVDVERKRPSTFIVQPTDTIPGSTLTMMVVSQTGRSSTMRSGVTSKPWCRPTCPP